MVIEKLRHKAQQEAAEQRAQEEARAARRRKRRVMLVSPALAAHAIFVPALVLWGAALGGLSVLALSSVTIARITMFTGLGSLGSSAHYAFAALAATLGGVLSLALAKLVQSAVRRSHEGAGLVSMAGRRVRPIDPASELGSDSLDTPIEEMPFAPGEAENEPEDEVPPGLYDTDEEPPVTQAPVTQGDEPSGEEPLELDAASEIGEDDVLALDTPLDAEPAGNEALPALDLGAFDAVEETESDNAAQHEGEHPDAGEAPEERDTAAALTAQLPAPQTGIEKLRQTAPKDLSLVQLVERFAAALHDVQDREPSDFTAAAGIQGHSDREAALAEALKALTLFSEHGFAKPDDASAKPPRRFGSSFSGQSSKPNTSTITETERQLRDALDKLQNLSGAA
ncbi:MAG: hypothetical protein AAGA34_04715 [Pseudomonadota bacterium]